MLRLAAASIGIFALRKRAEAQQEAIRIGTTLDISGVERAVGLGLIQGSRAYFQKLNKSGGIEGRRVELIAMDDAFNPEVARENAKTLLSDRGALALLSPVGTRQTAAVMDAVTDAAVVGPFTGTVALRKKVSPNTFFVRANYDLEVDKLIATAVSQSVTSIGLVHPLDPLGLSVLSAFNASMAKHGLKPSVIATTPGTISPEVQPAAELIAKAAPQVVIVCLAGMAPPFVQALRKTRNATTVYGMSLGASPSNIERLGPLSRGLGFSIVVPSPFALRHQLVRQYRADMRDVGVEEPSLISLEGWINARVLAEGLRKAGRSVNRLNLIAAMEQINSLDLGGLRVGFGKANREGSSFVDVAVIAANGQLRT